jgi:hypothetical protein
VEDATTGQDWTAPGGHSQPSVGQVPDVPTAAPVAAPAPPVAVAAAAPQPPAPTFRSWQPGLIPLRPASFGEFLSVPFKALRYNRAVIVGGPLLVVGASMLLIAAAMWLFFTDPQLAFLAPTDQFQGVQASTVIVGILAILGAVLAEVFASAIVASGFSRAVLGERIPLGEALKAVSGRLWQLVLLYLISGLAVLVAFVPGLIVLGLGAAGDDGFAVGMGIVLMIVLGFVVGVPVYLISAIARCVVVLERKGAVASLRRTMSLIRGRFWWSVLIVFVTATIISVATGVVQQLFSMIGSIALVLGVSGEWVGTAIFVAVLVLGMVVTYVFTYAYMGSVYAMIYIDARIRHEGFDLELARAAEARRG